MPLELHPDAIQALVTGEIGAPTSVLGRHQVGDEVSIRTFRPWAKRIHLVNDTTGDRVRMKKHHDEGLFIANLDATWANAPYHFETKTDDGGVDTYLDAYIFPATTVGLRYLSLRPGTAS